MRASSEKALKLFLEGFFVYMLQFFKKRVDVDLPFPTNNLLDYRFADAARSNVNLIGRKIDQDEAPNFPRLSYITKNT